MKKLITYFVMSILGFFPLISFGSWPVSTTAKSPGKNTPVNADDSNWSNRSNAYTSNNQYCEITSTKLDNGDISDMIKFSKFEFSIPTGAIVTGIYLELEANKKGSTGSCIDHVIQLINASGTLVGDNKATSTAWVKDKKDNTIKYGGEYDLWNTTLTVADINTTNFGIAIQIAATSNDTKPRIDNVRLIVTYTTTTLDNGPGGVGASDASTGLVAWFHPSQLQNSSNAIPTNGQAITTWADASGYANNAHTISGSEPIVSSNSLNGYGVAHFSKASAQYFSVTDHTSLNPEDISIFVVGNYTTSTDTWSPFVIKSNDWEWTEGYGIARDNAHNRIKGFVGKYDKNYVNMNVGTNTTAIMSMVYDKVNVETFLNETSTGTDTYDQSIPNSSNFVYLGASPDVNGTGVRNFLDGDIAEVIIINRNVNSVQRILIHNYLAAKYGLTLGTNDFYTRDNAGFDFNVAGIGMATDGSYHDNAVGTGIVTMSNPSSLSSDDYLIWGENKITPDYTFTTTNGYQEQLSSTWSVSKRNDLGTVTVGFDSLQLDLSNKQTCVSLKLIVSNSSSFTTKTTYTLSPVDGIYTATGVSFNDGDYFTIAYQDLIVLDHNGFSGGSNSDGSPSIADGCYKLLVTSSAIGTFNLGYDGEVRTLEIETGASVNIEPGISLTVIGDIINNGTLTVNEGGSIVQNTTGANSNTGTGTYTVKRSGTNSADIYNIWASPISAAAITNVFPLANPCDIYTFDRTSQSWLYDYPVGYTTTCSGNSVMFPSSYVISGGDGIMDVARGYFVPGAATIVKEYTGTINNGDYTIPVSTTSLGNPGGSSWGDDDWNLLGNPYPSGLSAPAFWSANSPNIGDAIYFWDAADSTGGYDQDSDYASWNSTGAVESGNSNKLPNGNIGSGQGFWVVATNSGNLNFNNSMRTDNNSQFFKTTENTDQHNAWFKLTSPSSYKSNILVGYNQNTTDSIDAGFDAHKLVGSGHVRLVTTIGSEEFVIQSMAPINIGDTKIIPLVVFSDESGAHVFSGYRRENIPTLMQIFIRDKDTGIDHDLSTGDYSAMLTAGVTYQTRFELVFVHQIEKLDEGKSAKGIKEEEEAGATITDITDVNIHEMSITQNENFLTIINPNNQQGFIQVMDLTGKVIISTKLNESSNVTSINWNRLSAGNYIVTINNSQNNLITQQLVKP